MSQAVVKLEGWARAAQERRENVLRRLIAGAAAALVFAPMLGLQITLPWLAVYTVAQGAEWLVCRPAWSKGGGGPAGWRGITCDLALFLNAAVFAFLALPLWLQGGAIGGVCAAIYLCSGMLNSIVMGVGSSRVTYLTIAPQALTFATTPWFIAQSGAGQPYVIASTIALLAFFAFCYSTRQRLDHAGRAEQAARREADRKRLEAEAAMNDRAALLAAVAHDLRTPIGAILSGAEELREDLRPSARRQQLDLIADAGRMMNDLLGDLLDHARLDAGRMTIDAGDFDLRLLLSQTARLWAGPIRAKGLRLRLKGSRSIPAAVRGDEMRLRQVLNNLISNALKFTEAGAITLSFSAWVDERGDHAVLIEVADTGRGLTAQQLRRLFTPFDQTADGVAARYGGSGLGLAISRELVELMGGRLTVRSLPDQGATFTVALSLPAALSPPVQVNPPAAEAPSLPLPARDPQSADAGTTAPADTSQEEGEPGEAPLRVLVVDDHDINRRAIQLILQAFDCEIAMAADGLSALEACGAAPFDVIFMDVRMPELDGRETTRRLRASGGPNASTPVIAVTADTAAEDIAACLSAGMDAFVAKPLAPAALIAALQQALKPEPPADVAAA